MPMLPAFFDAMGTDRYLTEQEVTAAAGSLAQLAPAWHLYERDFERFCETTIDPMCHRLTHPARLVGTLALDPGESVLVLGTGPSAVRALPVVARVRDRVRILTSPRGAVMLAGHGLVPDVVLVEHRTPLDAHHSTLRDHDGIAEVLAAGALVAAEWRTPTTLIARVPSARLFVPQPLPTWGWWPATLVAMAADAGAGRIALLGIDLGTAAQPNPEFEPLWKLLGLLARLAQGRIVTCDCGAGGAIKEGWHHEAIEAVAAVADGGRPLAPLEMRTHAAPAPDERRAAAREALGRLAPVLRRVREILSLALAARGGAPDVPALRAAAADLIAWRDDRVVRVDVQEALGASFLPRLWRLGIDPALGRALWRPLVLATHEIVGQAERLAAEAGRRAA